MARNKLFRMSILLVCIGLISIICILLYKKVTPNTDNTESKDLFMITKISREAQNEKGILRGYIDKSGKVVIEPSFKECHEFKEGVAAVKVNDKWGAIDKSSNKVVNPIYDEVRDFCHGMAAVRIGNKYGFVNKSDKLVIKPEYARVGNFSEGLAYVKDNKGNYGYINKRGKCIIKPQYYHAHAFEKGLAFVTIKTNNNYYYAFINRNNKVVWKRELSIHEKDVLEEEGHKKIG